MEPLPLDQIRIELREGMLAGDAGDQALWRLPLLTALKAEDKRKRTHGPVRAGGGVFLCIDTAAFEVDARTGQVRRRLQLPGSCLSLESDGSEVVRVKAGSEEQPPWSRTWELGPGRGEIPYFAFGQGRPGLGLFDRIQARRADLSDEPAKRKAQAQEPATRAELEAAISAFEQLERLDRTNPWYAFFRADYLTLLGRWEEAGPAYKAVLGFEPTSDCQLASLAAKLDRIDPALADVAWKRGMACLLARGHEPELVTALLTPMVVLGKPEQERLDPAVEADWAYLVRRAERLVDLSPAPEASATFWTAMAQAADARGLAAAAERYRGLAVQATPNATFAPVGPGVRYLGYWLNALFAIVLVLLGGLVVKVLRTVMVPFAQQAGMLRRFNPMARWQAGELIGLVLGVPILVWILYRVSVGVIIVGSIAAMPLSMGAGNLGHPAVVTWLDDMDPPDSAEGPLPDGARFIKALALQQAGELTRAEALYRGLPQPQAKVNLGVLLVAKGDRPAAEKLWTQALAQDPAQAEAARNLGKSTPSPRTDRADRFDLRVPLLAMPTVAMWDQLWHADVGRSFSGLLAPFETQAISEGLTFGEGGTSPTWSAMFYLLLAAAALALLALVTRFGQPPLKRQSRGRIGWWLGWLLPGTARHYGPLWPVAGGVFAFTLIGTLTMAWTDGQSSNVLDAIVMPYFNQYYGLSATVADPTREGLDGLASWTWVAVIFGLHLAFLGVMAKLRPDPAGPFWRSKDTDNAVD